MVSLVCMVVASLEERVDFGEKHFFHVPEDLVVDGKAKLRLAETDEQIKSLEELSGKSCLQAGYFKVDGVYRPTKDDKFEYDPFEKPMYVAFSTVDIHVVTPDGKPDVSVFRVVDFLAHPKNDFEKGILYIHYNKKNYKEVPIDGFGNPVEGQPGKGDGMVELDVGREAEHRKWLWNERQKIDYESRSWVLKKVTKAPPSNAEPPADYLRSEK